MGEFPRLSGWAQCNHGVLKGKERRGAVGEMLIMEKWVQILGTFRETCTAGFEGGGRQPQAKGYRQLEEAGKGKEGVSHGASRRRHSHGNILILAQSLCWTFATTEM